MPQNTDTCFGLGYWFQARCPAQRPKPVSFDKFMLEVSGATQHHYESMSVDTSRSVSFFLWFNGQLVNNMFETFQPLQNLDAVAESYVIYSVRNVSPIMESLHAWGLGFHHKLCLHCENQYLSQVCWNKCPSLETARAKAIWPDWFQSSPDCPSAPDWN